MKTIALGAVGDAELRIDLAKLVDTRALIQANSGGGKSWLLRRLAEKSIETIQTIILDPEGEFATLREKHDLVLVGEEGEVKTDPRGAGLMAHKLAELQVSAVIDLYDLEIPLRRRYVRLFLEALVAIPKKLYHPLLVILDESHMFCPERTSGEAESTAAVINLLSLGRKRGMCGILATQRLSKLHKDAEAECNNVFIGRTVQDLDQARAARVLGMKPADALVLRDFKPGEFFTFGPAIVTPGGIIRFTAGDVQTTHPRAGQRHKLHAPKASDAVKQLVTHLADLPQQAEEEARTLGDAQRKIRELERQLRQAAKPKTVEVASRAEAQTIRTLRKGIEEAMKIIAKINASGFDKPGLDAEQIRKAVEAATGQIVKMVEADLNRKSTEFEKLRKEARGVLAKLQTLLGTDSTAEVNVKHEEPLSITPLPPLPSPQPPSPPRPGDGKNARGRILNALAWWKAIGIEQPDKLKVALAAGYTVNGHFTNILGSLRTDGLIEYPGPKLVALTDLGEAEALPVDAPVSREELAHRIRQVIGSPAHLKLFDVLYERNEPLRKEDLAALAGYTVNGHFTNVLGRLRSMGVVKYPFAGVAAINDELFKGLA